jgi:hypothetical protein
MAIKIGLSQHGQLFTSNSAKYAVQNALNKTKVYGLGLIQASTPVRTGEARAGWSVIQEGKGLTWQNRVPHSVYLEFGTRFMRARPMLAPNLPKIKDHFRRELVKSIGRNAASSVVSKGNEAVSFDSATAGYQPPKRSKRRK